MMEELGFEVDLSDYLGQADEYFYSRHRGTFFIIQVISMLQKTGSKFLHL